MRNVLIAMLLMGAMSAQADDVMKKEKDGTYVINTTTLAQDVEGAERRCIALREAGAEPFCQPYRDFTTNAEPPVELRQLARWVNDKAIFKTVRTFGEYRARKG